MYFTGFADEASKGLEGQIKATKELGWTNIESRAIDGVNIHDLPEDKFNQVADALDAAGIHVNCFGSTICNWAKKITDPFDITLEEINSDSQQLYRFNLSRKTSDEGTDPQAQPMMSASLPLLFRLSRL